MSSIPGPSGSPSSRSDRASPDPAPDRPERPASLTDLEARPETRRTLAYCSATDRNVPVLVKIARRRSRRRRPSYREAERLVCLDYGVRCTGWLCPLFDVPTLNEAELRESPHRRPS